MPIPIQLPTVTDANLKSFDGTSAHKIQVVGIAPFNLVPVVATQANSQITVSSTALSLSSYQPSDATHAEISVATNAIRWWDDGKTPTVSQGKLLEVGDYLKVEAVSSFKFIAVTGSATLTISWYKLDGTVGTPPPTPPTAVPGIPTGLTVTLSGSNVLLQWNDNPTSDQVDVYQVYVDDSNTHPQTNLAVPISEYTVTGLTGTHTFRVSAHNSVGYGAWTAAQSVTISTGGTNFGTALPARIPPSTGTQYYVSTTGNDSNTGTIGNPWLTIQKALDTVPLTGSIINIRGGTYTDADSNIIWSRAGSGTNPVTLQAYTGENVLINGARLNIKGSYLRVTKGSGANFTIQDGGSGLVVDARECIRIDNAAHHIDIDGLRLTGADRQGILMGDASLKVSDIQLWNCIIDNNGGLGLDGQDHGIYTANVLRLTVANCLFYNNPNGYGLHIYPDADDVIVTGCTVDEHTNSTGATGGGMIISGGSSSITNNVTVVGCLFTDQTATTYGVQYFMNATNVNVYDCLAHDHAGTGFNTGGGFTYTNCVGNTDPLYVGKLGRDYRLQTSSPARQHVQAARYSYLPGTFMDGTARSTGVAGCLPVISSPAPTLGTALPARLATSQGNGGTIYISPTGNDTTGNGSISAPYFSYHKAFQMVNLTGGLILARGGTYNYVGFNGGQQQFNRIGNVNNPPQIKAYPGESPVFNGSMFLIGATTTTKGLRVGPGLRFTNPPNTASWDAVRVECAGYVEIVGCEIDNAPYANGLLVSYITQIPTQVQVWDSSFHHNGNTTTQQYHGVYFGGGDNTCLVANCTFYDNAGFNAQFGPECNDLIVTGCTAYENDPGGYGGFALWDQSGYSNSNNRVYGCIVSTIEYAYAYSWSGNASPTPAHAVRDSIAHNCPGTYEPGSNMIISNLITGNPNFVNAAARDLRIGAGSAAINLVTQANQGYLPALDKNGVARQTRDAGAFAYIP